jgi:hypothetical protein
MPTTQLHVVPYLKINGCRPPLPDMPRCLIKHTGNFTVVVVVVGGGGGGIVIAAVVIIRIVLLSRFRPVDIFDVEPLP